MFLRAGGSFFAPARCFVSGVKNCAVRPTCRTFQSLPCVGACSAPPSLPCVRGGAQCAHWAEGLTRSPTEPLRATRINPSVSLTAASSLYTREPPVRRKPKASPVSVRAAPPKPPLCKGRCPAGAEGLRLFPVPPHPRRCGSSCPFLRSSGGYEVRHGAFARSAQETERSDNFFNPAPAGAFSLFHISLFQKEKCGRRRPGASLCRWCGRTGNKFWCSLKTTHQSLGSPSGRAVSEAD